MSEERDAFLQPTDARDFALLIEGSKVYVNRGYLATWSPVFQKIFYPQGAPFSQPKGGMVLNDKKLDDFLSFLCCISPSSKILQVNESNLSSLVAYADEYDIPPLRQRCDAFMTAQLKANLVVGETLVEYLRLTSVYNYKHLQKRLLPMFAERPCDEIKAAHEALPLSVLAAVYQAKALLADMPTLQTDGVVCSSCVQQIHSFHNGASACCKVGVFFDFTRTAAKVAKTWTFTCCGCSKSCDIRNKGAKYYKTSSCCDEGMLIFLKNAAEGPAAKRSRLSADFSDELLDRKL